MVIGNITLYGSVFNEIRLTPDQQPKSGHVWNTIVCTSTVSCSVFHQTTLTLVNVN